MKRFLYAMMAASLVIAACGTKKAPQVKQAAAAETAYTDHEIETTEELLRQQEEAIKAASEALEEEIDELQEEEEEAEEELEEEIEEETMDKLAGMMEDIDPEDLKQAEDIFKNMTPEEIEAAEEAALKELTQIILREKRQGKENMDEDMGPDALENLSPEDEKNLADWQADAAEWARRELELAAAESAEAGLQSVMFAENSADLLPSEDEKLAENIEIVRQKLSDGHQLIVPTSAGSNEENPEELAQLRAEKLHERLIQAGLNADQLHVTGYADSLDGVFGSNMGGSSASFLLV